MDKVLERLERHADVGEGATEAEVAAAERAIGCRLPGSYRAFLRRVGWASVGADEIYGLGDRVPAHVDVVRMTLSEREEVDPECAIPAHLVPLRNDGAGNHDCLDTSKMADGECPVVFWDHELGPDQRPRRVAAGFEAWLGKMLPKEAAKKTAKGSGKSAGKAAELTKFLERLKRDAKELGRSAKLWPGVGEAAIDAAAAELGVELPAAYRAFLAGCGGAKVIEAQLYGLGEGVPDNLNLVMVTQKLRGRRKRPLPRELVAVGRDPAEIQYFLDTSRVSGGDCPVMIWDPRPAELWYEEEAGSFVKWVKKFM